jgi:hypothetical protein
LKPGIQASSRLHAIPTSSIRARARTPAHPLVIIVGSRPRAGNEEVLTMRVLVATNETQGSQPGDYAWTVEGELVTAVAVECCTPRTCGCGRGFPGLASSRATTTAMVVDRPDLDAEQVRGAIEDSLERGGWLDALDDEEIDELVEEHLICIGAVWSSFAVGTVVSRWGANVYSRPAVAAA